MTPFPGLVRLVDDRSRLRQAYQRAQAALCAIGLPVGFAFAAIARPLILLTMGAKWMPVAFIIEYLSCGFALQTLSTVLQPLAMAVGETRQLFRRDVLNLVVRLPLLLVGIYADGLMGIVYARCFSGIVIMNLINMTMVRRLLDLPVRVQFAANIRSLAGAAVMMASMFAVAAAFRGEAPLALSAKIGAMITSGGLVYVGVLYGLWRTAGRPPGPESEMTLMVAKLLSLLAPPHPVATATGEQRTMPTPIVARKK